MASSASWWRKAFASVNIGLAIRREERTALCCGFGNRRARVVCRRPEITSCRTRLRNLREHFGSQRRQIGCRPTHFPGLRAQMVCWRGQMRSRRSRIIGYRQQITGGRIDFRSRRRQITCRPSHFRRRRIENGDNRSRMGDNKGRGRFVFEGRRQFKGRGAPKL